MSDRNPRNNADEIERRQRRAPATAARAEAERTATRRAEKIFQAQQIALDKVVAQRLAEEEARIDQQRYDDERIARRQQKAESARVKKSNEDAAMAQWEQERRRRG